MGNKELAKTQNSEMQMTALSETKKGYEDFVKFSTELLKDGIDFGIIPGTKKNTLFKAGAEKIRMVYQLGMNVEKTEDMLDIENDFYSCIYKVTITTKSGQQVGQCEGSCNTYESKYKYRWIPCDDIQGDEYKKVKALGTHKKVKNYDQQWETLERIDNENKIAIMNTIQKMAQKRAFVGAMVISVGASEFFTQDLEDLKDDLGIIPDETSTVNTQKKYKDKDLPLTTPAKKGVTPNPQPGVKDKAYYDRIRKSDRREDGMEKDWMNDPEIEDFEKMYLAYKSYGEAMDAITLKYKVNKKTRERIQKLYN